MRIEQLMSGHVVTITPEESVALAARLLARHDLGLLPVCQQDGQLAGVVTDRDIVVRCLAAGADPSRVPVRDIMSRQVHTAQPSEDAKQAIERMGRHQLRRLPVVDRGQVVGVVSLGDAARSRRFETEAARALGEISMNVRHRR